MAREYTGLLSRIEAAEARQQAVDGSRHDRCRACLKCRRCGPASKLTRAEMWRERDRIDAEIMALEGEIIAGIDDTELAVEVQKVQAKLERLRAEQERRRVAGPDHDMSDFGSPGDFR